MSMMRPGKRLRRLRDERGFTLTELLVGMVAGVIVTSALFTILDVTLHQTTQTFSRVDATQRARTAIETIQNELHSACYANDVAPVIAGSTATSLSFWTQYGAATNLTPTKHTITLDTATDKLTDTTYTTTGTAPGWVAGSPSLTKTLLTNVDQSGTTPVFQYYAITSTGTTSIPAAPLSDANSHRVSDIRITFLVKPAGGSHENINVAPNTVSNRVTLRLTPIPNPSPTVEEFKPCD